MAGFKPNHEGKEVRTEKASQHELNISPKTQPICQENVIGRLENHVPISDIPTQILMEFGLDSPIPSPTHAQGHRNNGNHTRTQKRGI